MAVRLSRRKIAAHVAGELLAGTPAPKVLRAVAAYLVDTRRTREAVLLIRDIEEALATHGHVVADIASAHPLSQTLKDEIASLVGGKILHVRESVDPNLLGGIRIDTPGKRLDGTIRHRLTALRAQQL